MPGPTIVAIFSLGVHPTGMKNAVRRPQAMIAPMLGMTMLDKKVPNFCTCTRKDGLGAVAVDEAIGFLSFARARDARHGPMHRSLHLIGRNAKHSDTDLCPFVWLFCSSGR